LKEKVVTICDPHELVYDRKHWDILAELRAVAGEILSRLPAPGFVYGSVARGDVHGGSDIDIVMVDPIPSYQLELCLPEPVSRTIVQATPNSPVRAHIHLDHRTTVTVPLVPLAPKEEGFYTFAGRATVENLDAGRRVPGVNKRLLLIEPTETGHIASGVLDHPTRTARVLGVHTATLDERIRVLTRRDRVGRTGVLLNEELHEGETFESRLRYIADRNSVVRRQLRLRGAYV
jgi:uncharacterized protein